MGGRRIAVVFALLLLTGCGDAGSPPTSGGVSTSAAATASPEGRGTLVVALVWNPVCGPDDATAPGCTPEALQGVEATVRDDSGTVVARAQSDARGEASFDLPPGDYTVEVADADRVGAITPAPAPVSVTGAEPVTLTLTYESNLQ